MSRRFTCAPADLVRFSKTMEDKIWKRFYPDVTREQCMRLLTEGRMRKLKETHGIEPDKITAELIKIAMECPTWDNHHYAVHHLIWQEWDAAKRGKIQITDKRRKWLDKVTEDCLDA